MKIFLNNFWRSLGVRGMVDVEILWAGRGEWAGWAGMGNGGGRRAAGMDANILEREETLA